MSEQPQTGETLAEALDELFAQRDRLDKVLDEIEDRIVDQLPVEPATCPVMGILRSLAAAPGRFWGFIVGTISGWKGNIPA